MSLQKGDRVDRYEIIALLGEGGMGEVYRAHDTRLQRSVALKLLRPLPPSEESSSASGGAARILREARLAASLEHPNIVGVYDVGELHEPEEARGTAYLAMELVRGRSLRAYVGDESIPITERVRWLVDVARALGAAHARGLVHRDVKPENVMVREDGTIKVLDFGVAKRTFVPVGSNSSTEGHVLSTLSSGGVVGTPYYMAPEQLRNETLDGRADQFAWAVMGYELLTGHGPWGIEGGALQLVSEILSKTPPAPHLVRPEISPDLSAAIVRAMSRSPPERFALMEDAAAALSDAPDAFAQTAAVIRVSTRDVAKDSSATDVSPHAATVSAMPATAPTVRVPSTKPPPPATRRSRRWLPVSAVAAVLVVGVAAYALRSNAPAVVATGSAGATAVAASSAPTTGCASNDACAQRLGAPAICHANDGSCALLASPDCTVLASPADIANDATLWIGAMFPLGTDYGKGNAHAVELARRDFAQVMGAVASRAGSGARPIGVVSCDDAVDAARVAHHLADEVRVPAIIGFRSSAELIELASTTLIPRGVLAMAAVNTSPLLATIPHPADRPRMVWRTTYNTLATIPAITAFTNQLLSQRKTPGSGEHGGARVAVLRDDNAAGLAFAEALFRKLRFNGKSALDNGADFREVVSGAGDATASTDDERSVESLVAFAPRIVIVSGGDALARRVIEPLERRWSPARGPKPQYVAMSVLSPEFFRVIGKNAERRRRFYGITSVSNTPANARFVMRYNDAFDDKITRTIAPNTAYDAFYLLAFGAYAIGDGAITGAALGDAMKRLIPPGKAVEIGPTTIFDAFNALRAGENVDVTGATGALDFDPRTGEAPVDMVVLCVATNAEGNAEDTMESGLVFRATKEALEGSMRCP